MARDTGVMIAVSHEHDGYGPMLGDALIERLAVAVILSRVIHGTFDMKGLAQACGGPAIVIVVAYRIEIKRGRVAGDRRVHATNFEFLNCIANARAQHL